MYDPLVMIRVRAFDRHAGTPGGFLSC
jgi:hypothetical protein